MIYKISNSTFHNYFKILAAFILTLVLIIFNILSIPVYIFRTIVATLAKILRPDLGEILNGHSALFTNDYFAKTPPRTNIVVTAILEGLLTLEELTSLVMKNWITATDKTTGELAFQKLQQYPERWLGFTFWKDYFDKFSIENHIYRAFDKYAIVDENKLNDLVEKLLNSKFPSQQSPWEFHVIENYHSSDVNDDIQQKSVLIFKVHHCLADGFSILTSFLEGLFGYSMSNMQIPVAKPHKRSFQEKLLNLFIAPFNGILELSYLLSHNFKSSPWKISDKNKEWYQVCTKSEPIPIQYIKDIKNRFGVSFTSVLLSAISAGIFKVLEEDAYNVENGSKNCTNPDSMLFLSTLPAPGYTQTRKMTNQLTAAVFDIPVGKFKCSLERLEAVDKVLENARKSILPALLHIGSDLMGAHLHFVSKTVVKNRMISTGLTNFPSVPIRIEMNGKPVIDVDFVTGGIDGDAGVGIMTLSYNQQIRVGITAEKALMSRPRAKQFVKFVTEEIQHLHVLMEKS